jgi:multidrug efflux pump subunit AcrB
MIMAVGLSVDYAVYFAQRFMTCTADGTGNGRMQVALADTGSAVFLGGLTALVGTIPMAFSQSVIIRTFFKLIFGTIIFALLVGLMLMPVIFSLIPLPPVKSALVDEGSHSSNGDASKDNGRVSDASGDRGMGKAAVNSDMELGTQRM